MSGHRNVGGAGMTQNQGNVIGDRPCVRQSKLFRQHDSGNAMKDLLGQQDTKWDVNQQQGAYAGKSVYDHNTQDNRAPRPQQAQQQAPPQQQQQQQYQQDQYQQQQPQYEQPPAAPAPAPQQQQQQPQQQARGGRQNYHNQNANFNFFTGEAK